MVDCLAVRQIYHLPLCADCPGSLKSFQQQALTNDHDSLSCELRSSIPAALPGPIDVQVDQIPVARIVLDERNPRIAHVVGDIKSAPPQEWIPRAARPRRATGRSCVHILRPEASIRAQRGLFMPVIVTPRPDGDYTVIEGNTRVAIFRELADEGAPGNWDSIPAIVQSNRPEAGERGAKGCRSAW
jgi:ParB-like nuclease family protein